MSLSNSLPNSHEALLRNRDLLTGRVALIGPASPSILAELPAGGIAVSEHAGQVKALESQADWQICYGYDVSALQPASCDVVSIFLPKVRAELDLRLALARWLGRDGATIILVGEKKEGIAGAIKQLRAVAPDAGKIDSARHCQVWTATNSAPLERFEIADWFEWHTVSNSGVSLQIAGLPGIFSKGELDDGTARLLDSLAEAPLKASKVLDFACGAGVVGAWLQGWQAANDKPVTPVDAVDVQYQAVTCARATYDRAGAKGDIIASDGLSELEGRWSAVVTNPPFHAGVKTDTSMTENFLRDVARHLTSGGELRLVANTFLPYETMIKRFVGPVERLYEDRKFTVYRAVRR
ncbi:class I SAM-dependent methyltransferase [Marinobacter salinexigens]|uniref:Ribosomal RNA small subunit methyltransferase C n=1 Tax=Marinobacter salinexigens TaxID=2919747 RepID=A0A5B0VJM0_9GAMM|nr:class I SAM-dependent methyltransferase [Marinobacter salinexigens]KAA1174826.1 class I SAM-dependent methyltransferase [Marinobacter salinexigens]